MLDYMPEEIFALHIDPVEGAHVVSLPRMYAREFETGVFTLGDAASGVEFVAIGSRLRPDLKMLKGAIDALRLECEHPVVVVSPSLDYWQKEWLASRRLPFIQDAQNAYLPFAGLAARGPSRDRRPSLLSPQAQRIVVNLVEGNWNVANAGELAKRLGRSRASITKYLAEIEAICPGVVTRAGRTTVLSCGDMARADLLDCFEPYLRSPVSRRFRISYGVGPDELREVGARLSGLTALAQMSDIAANENYPTVAIPQDALESAMSALGEAGDELPWWDEEGTNVEVWGYWDDFPTDLQDHSFGSLDAVGRLSLYLSLKNQYEDDVRVADAVDQLREEICQ